MTGQTLLPCGAAILPELRGLPRLHPFHGTRPEPRDPAAIVAFGWRAVVDSVAWIVRSWRYGLRIPQAGNLLANGCFVAAAMRPS